MRAAASLFAFLEAAMATVVGTLAGFIITNAPKDVEADSNSSVNGTVNVQVERFGENSGFISFQAPASVLATITPSAPCTITISQ